MSTLASPDVRPGPSSPMSPRRRLVLLSVMLLAAFAVMLNETLLGVALPTLMRDLSVSAAAAQWSTAVFLLTMAVVSPIGGYLLTRFGIRHLYVGAMAVFTAGTLAGALAPGLPVLLGGRVLQATGTAVMVPLMTTTLMRLVPDRNRGLSMGLVGLVMSAAPALGPTASGLILHRFGWRGLFVTVLPVALLALGVGAALAPRERGGETAGARVDGRSVCLSVLGFGGVVLGLSDLGRDSEALVDPRLSVLVGAAALCLFLRRQSRLQDEGRAFLDLRPFRFPSYRLTAVLTCVTTGSILGSAILLPLYATQVLGVSPLTIGKLLLPGGLAAGLLGPVVGFASDRLAPAALMLPGAGLFSAAMWLMTTFSTTTSLRTVVAAHVGMCVGSALLNTPVLRLGLGSLPESLHGHASSALTTLQMVAGAAASSLFVALLSRGVRRAPAGTDPVAAVAGGVHGALLAAAVLSLATVLVAARVRRLPGPPLASARPTPPTPPLERTQASAVAPR